MRAVTAVTLALRGAGAIRMLLRPNAGHRSARARVLRARAGIALGHSALHTVAIPADCAEAFLTDIERLAVEKCGAATFNELLEKDLGDASAEKDMVRLTSKKIAQCMSKHSRFSDEDLKRLQEAADRDKAKHEKRKKLEESTRRKETKKQNSLQIKVVKPS